jgi:hypothetical protein
MIALPLRAGYALRTCRRATCQWFLKHSWDGWAAADAPDGSTPDQGPRRTLCRQCSPRHQLAALGAASDGKAIPFPALSDFPTHSIAFPGAGLPARFLVADRLGRELAIPAMSPRSSPR